MPFRKPQDPEALQRWKAVQRAVKAKEKAAAKTDPKLLALKKAAKERQEAVYEKARERNRALLAEAKKRQREALAKAKELAAAKRTTALIRKHVRPATVTAADPTPAALSSKEPPSRPEARRRTSTPAKPTTTNKPRPVQLAFANLATDDE